MKFKYDKDKWGATSTVNITPSAMFHEILINYGDILEKRRVRDMGWER